MPAEPFPGPFGVVLFGLGAALGWGVSDFGGGVTSRLAPLLGVLAVTQLVGAAIALPVAVARGEGFLSPADLGWSAASGALGTIGIASLYHGLRVGRMGVVAPVAGVLVAGMPVTAGMILEGVPRPLVVVGILLAITSVVIVSRIPGEAGEASSGLWWGIAAGLPLGGVTLTLSQMSSNAVFEPLAIMRVIEGVVFVLVILVTRGDWHVPRQLWPAMLAIGALDMVATASYIGATHSGPLAIAGVLSALYPVVTVVLAATVLRERVTPVHGLGIVAAGVAIAFIAGGSAT
jgi:drug/metabolite transporter (DMT)-like permease